ncbi:arsenate reductase ArsC [Erysipelothrix urinaevulpis]|uniref:arsenate reductase/protein-tyrosine-phosphatase family protein n=1 Tax=Erysipelothrix urinaevulpis TaxID=2683717 RepID=UPI00135CF658|nr:arsenate reductase ArsC [Erysipelothrix urinaevulpis]
MSHLPSVAFVCVHNSCRSQMAEAIAKLKYRDSMSAYSAGTDLSRGINQDAIRLIKKIYDYDLAQEQSNTHINDLDSIDIVITMGCNVSCPSLQSTYRFDWGLDDPSGQGDKEFQTTIEMIEEKLRDLNKFIQENY